MKGAPRDAKDHQDRKPIDLVELISSNNMRDQLRNDLREPKEMSCLMLKTPLKKVSKNATTAVVMWFLVILVYIHIVLFLLPLYYQVNGLVWTQLAFLLATLFLHSMAMCRDPGFL